MLTIDGGEAVGMNPPPTDGLVQALVSIVETLSELRVLAEQTIEL
ncbi:MAG: hypothetical protein WBP81_31720 [Solirubrobacteraceae bacterium]